MKHKEQGAALVIGLLLLAVATIVGVAGLSRSNMQERIASNQKQQTEAMMAAEVSISTAATWFDDHHDEIDGWCSEGDSSCANDRIADIHSDSILSLGNGISWSISQLVFGTNQVKIRSIGAIANSGTEREIEVTYILPTPSAASPSAESAFTCFGADCNVRIGGSGEVDGRDYNVPSDFSCSGSGCNGTLTENPAKIGVYLPGDGEICKTSGPSETRCDPTEITAVSGDPHISITTEYQPPSDQDGCDSSCWNDFSQNISSSTTPIIDVSISDGNLGTRDNPVLTAVAGEVHINGDVNGAGIMVIKPNPDTGVGIFRINGTFHYEGLVIIEPGVTVDFGSGNARIFGSMIMIEGLGDILIDAAFTGNVAIKYSSEAINNANAAIPSNDDRRIVEWKEIMS